MFGYGYEPCYLTREQVAAKRARRKLALENAEHTRQDWLHKMVAIGDAAAVLPVPGQKRAMFIFANQALREGLSSRLYERAMRARSSPKVSDMVILPSAHETSSFIQGCVMSSAAFIYPSVVGRNMSEGVSMLQLNLPASELASQRVCHAVMAQINQRMSIGSSLLASDGAGCGWNLARYFSVRDGRDFTMKPALFDNEMGRRFVTQGATTQVCDVLGVPREWASRLEQPVSYGPDGSSHSLEERFDGLVYSKQFDSIYTSMKQLGIHAGRCRTVNIASDPRAQTAANALGIIDQSVTYTSHAGASVFGYALARIRHLAFYNHFRKWNIDHDRQASRLYYAPADSELAHDTLCDLAMAANFSAVNHLLINKHVLESFQHVIPGVTGKLVYQHANNSLSRETDFTGKGEHWVHRRGAVKAYPAGHAKLQNTPFADTGSPIFFDGVGRDDSRVLLAGQEIHRSHFSINPDCGFAVLDAKFAQNLELGSKQVKKENEAHRSLSDIDNGLSLPGIGAYKNAHHIIESLTHAGLASEVARLKTRFVIQKFKDYQDRIYRSSHATRTLSGCPAVLIDC